MPSHSKTPSHWRRLAAATVAAYAGYLVVRTTAPRLPAMHRTVEDVLRQYEVEASARLRPHFERSGVRFPPPRLALLAFKLERRVELWGSTGTRWAKVRVYPMTATSGTLGPKLHEGDRQVPEGIYRIIGLNPNSKFHLSMKLDYPNAFDRAMAARERREDLGGDIFIHGKAKSIGCIALGDQAIEELFVLVERTGRENVEVIIAPRDGERLSLPPEHDSLPWLPQLYEEIEQRLALLRQQT